MPQVTGRLAHGKYCGAAVFLTDYFPGVIFPRMITSTNMEETINGKLTYERLSYNHGVKIQYYRGDNIRYNE